MTGKLVLYRTPIDHTPGMMHVNAEPPLGEGLDEFCGQAKTLLPIILNAQSRGYDVDIVEEEREIDGIKFCPLTPYVSNGIRAALGK